MTPELQARLTAATTKLVARYGPPPIVVQVPPPPPPPVTSVGAGLSGLALVSDDFTKYATTADLHAAISVNLGGTGNWQSSLYGDGRGATQVSIDGSVQYNGHHTMRYDFPVNGAPPELWPAFTPLDDVWMRAVIRFSPGFTTVGNNPGASNAYKLLGWGLTGGVDGSGRIEITNTNQYELYWSAALSGTSTAIVDAEHFAYPGKITTEWTDGLFNEYVIHWGKVDASTVNVGCWIRPGNAAAPTHVSTVTKILNGHSVPQVYAYNLGMNYNQPILSPMSIWYGLWEVVDGSKHPNPFGITGG